MAEEIGELNVVVRRCRLEKEEKAWLLMRSEMATETFCIEALEAAGSLKAVAQQGAKRQHERLLQL